MTILKDAISQFRNFQTYKESDINFFVLLLENPKSPFNLTGVTDLYKYDFLHIILNRGMEIRDKALVIGFTMGNSKFNNGFIKWLYILCARWLYPTGCRFSEDDVKEYNRGYFYGSTRRKRNIHLEDFDINDDLSVIRKKFGINIIDLKDYPNLSTF